LIPDEEADPGLSNRSLQWTLKRYKFWFSGVNVTVSGIEELAGMVPEEGCISNSAAFTLFISTT
jgi:hypothetical protein